MAKSLSVYEAVPEVANPMLPHLYTLSRVHKNTADTFTMELEPLSGEIPPFLPGQFNMLYVFGVGEVPISISGDPDRRRPLVHTTREVGAVTRAMRALKPGEIIGVRGPYGTPWPLDVAEGNDVIFLAGGIGLAPLRPALYRVLTNRKKFGKVVLLYGTRSPEDILYRSELASWRARFDIEVFVTVDRAIGQWRGNVGVVTTLVPKAPFDPKNTVAMICGPEIMMTYSVAELQKRGVPESSIYLSMERNMKCGVGHCGHCQFGPKFVCVDGPVFRYSEIQQLLGVHGL